MTAMLILVLLLVLLAEFVNGWTDAPNSIATVVSTKVISPKIAVILAIILNILGTASGTAVAFTIGKGIVDSSVIDFQTIAAALISLILWSSLAARWGIPTSESHALVAGLSGAALAAIGPKALIWYGWQKVLLGLVFSSLIGFGLGYLFSKLIVIFCAGGQPNPARKFFSRLQILSSMLMAFSHGLNDGQKFIGVFTMTLVVGGWLKEFTVPFWVILICALTMGIGTSIGGWKIIKKIGMEMVDIEPWQGVAVESGSFITILVASLLGIPLSTTHTVGTALMGAGAVKSFSRVKWDIVQKILLAWVVTFPICGALSFVINLLFIHL